MSEFFYYVLYALVVIRYCVFTYVNLPFDIPYNLYFTVVAGILVVIIVYALTYTYEELFFGILILGGGALVWYHTKDETFLVTIVLLLLFKGYDVRKLVWVDCLCKILVVICTIFANVIGVLENVVKSRGAEQVIIRNAMGFTGPNILGGMVAMIIVDLLYLNYKSLKYWKLAIFFALAQVIGNITNSRTGILVSTGSIIAAFLFIKNSMIKRAALIGCKWFVPVLSVGSVLASFFFGKFSFLNTLNQWMTQRLYLGNLYFKIYGVGMWGKEISFYTEKYHGIFYITLDNLYIRILINFGFIVFALYIIGFFFVGRRIQREENAEGMILLIGYSLFGVTESIGYNICFNLPILFLAGIIFSGGKK